MQAFLTKNSINCGGQLISLANPAVMGILNITPDSFFSNSRMGSNQQLLSRTEQMLEAGAMFIDVGGQSTRPGADKISVEEELARVIPAIQAIMKEFPQTRISIDTFYAAVAKAAVQEGATLVNDISAGEEDAEMFSVLGELKVPYIMMHKKGTVKAMQQQPKYENIVLEIAAYFSEKLSILNDLGVADIILDPGFGFGKTLAHNYELLGKLDHFKIFDQALLVGLSRKSMIQKVIGKPAEEALYGTLSANMIALMKGAKILRVHDVKETIDLLRVYEAYRQNNLGT